MTTATITPTLPSGTVTPWAWTAEDRRIAARIDHARATADPRIDAEDYAALLALARSAS